MSISIKKIDLTKWKVAWRRYHNPFGLDLSFNFPSPFEFEAENENCLGSLGLGEIISVPDPPDVMPN